MLRIQDTLTLVLLVKYSVSTAEQLGKHKCDKGKNLEEIDDCVCAEGYNFNLNEGICVDIDECELGLNSCEQNCFNAEGNFTCACNKGYALSADGKTCQVAFCNNYADLAFVVDVSGSIEGDGENPGFFDSHVKPFLANFVQKLKVGPENIQIGMVTFGNAAKLEFPLKSDIKDVISGIGNIVYPKHGENTNTSGGINVMRTQVLGANSPNYRSQAVHVAIVVTDGYSTYDHNKTVPSAKEAKSQGIIMLSIGVTFKIDLQELVDIASAFSGTDLEALKEAKTKGVFMSSGSVAYVPSITGLDFIVNQLTSSLSHVICG